MLDQIENEVEDLRLHMHALAGAPQLASLHVN
jgi:hypothetical protein